MNLKQHKIAALKYARQRIVDGSSTYICYALSYYSGESYLAEKAVVYLEDYIAKSLGNYGTLTQWVSANSNVHFNFIYNTKKMLRTRLAYIDWMLSCYEGTK